MHHAMTAIQGGGSWMWTHMGLGGWTMMIGWVVILLVLVVGARAFARDGRSLGTPPGGSRDRAEEVLREEYARGEIDEKTYRMRLHELRRY